MAIESPYAGLFFCKKCKKTKSEKDFYGSNNLTKYPSGKLDLCKDCCTMHIDNWNPDTYMWLLEECDVPYIPNEWIKLMEKYAQNPSKVTGATIIGRYLGKMHLAQYRDYRWSDTEFLQELEKQKIEATMKAQGGYSASEIAQAVEESKTAGMPPPPPPVQSVEPNMSAGGVMVYANGVDDSDEDVQLSSEEIAYLKLKWGKTYRPYEWVQLEKLYKDMTDSYDIQTAGAIDTLKFICKTSLKANQLLDLGD